jgi:hypothetical protein
MLECSVRFIRVLEVAERFLETTAVIICSGNADRHFYSSLRGAVVSRDHFGNVVRPLIEG